MTAKILHSVRAVKIKPQISFATCKYLMQKSFTITALLLMFFTQQAFGQLNDDFSDGEFTSNPMWSGNDVKFTVFSNQLKLQAPALASTAYLATASKSINDASWEFLVKLSFNPSSTNYARVYLVSDQADLSGNVNGYFVLIGDTPDEVSLYRQEGNIRTKIID